MTLRAALKHAKRSGLWHGDVTALLPVGFAPEYKPKTRALKPAELHALLAELTPDRAARVAFIVATSANWGESESARGADVAADLSTVKINGTKTKFRERTVPIVAAWQRSLLEHALTYVTKGSPRLFIAWQNVRRDLHEACARAGIEPCSPNDLRRTTATWLRAAGVPADVIGGVLGHADSRMVERVYGRFSPEMLRQRLSVALGEDCDTGVPEPMEKGSFSVLAGQTQRANQLKTVPRAGIEPATRGFSVPCSTN